MNCARNVNRHTSKKDLGYSKTQKTFKPLQEDEMKLLADRIKSGNSNSTPQDLHARYAFHVRNLLRIGKSSEMVCPIEIRLEDLQSFEIRPRRN